jgi:hypothetical protein
VPAGLVNTDQQRPRGVPKLVQLDGRNPRHAGHNRVGARAQHGVRPLGESGRSEHETRAQNHDQDPPHASYTTGAASGFPRFAEYGY